MSRESLLSEGMSVTLAIEFGKIFNTVGLILIKRNNQLKDGYDITLEASSDLEKSAILSLQILLMISRVATCIVTVLTPVDQFHKPDLEPQ